MTREGAPEPRFEQEIESKKGKDLEQEIQEMRQLLDNKASAEGEP